MPSSTVRDRDSDLVLVLDFGAQYAQLIARRVREAHIYSEIVPGTISAKQLAAREPSALILSGGPASVYEPNAPVCDPAIFDLDIPVLGICFGHQLMAQTLGGKVASSASEYGRANLTVARKGDSLFAGLPKTQTVWMSHADSVTETPKGFRATAMTDATSVAAMEDTERRFYGVQFHPEVSHTSHGQSILKQFLLDAAGLKPTWRTESIIDSAIDAVRKQVGDARAVCALSGGVDSAVAATLVKQAIGDRLTCIFVDHGLLRNGEADQVEATFSEMFGDSFVAVSAEDRFLRALHDKVNPEVKRKMIGKTFIDIFQEECNRLDGVNFLVQGTIYPDWIESGGNGNAAGIKSHHNVGGLPPGMTLKLVEPLRGLFKDEVRRVGSELGLSDDIVWRQPFPGPGLAVRIIGKVNRKRLAILRAADAIVRYEVSRSDCGQDLWQAFAVLPTFRSVGVQGDGRTYAYSIIVRAVSSVDAMTADWVRLPHETLDIISRRITSEVPGINRVFYDISSKPPATIELE